MNKISKLVLAAFIIAAPAQGMVSPHQFLDAAKKGDLQTVQQYIHQGSDINFQDMYGCTALYNAVTCDSNAVVPYLVDNGANLNQTTSAGWTALHWAVNCNYKKTARYLIDKGANLNIQNNLRKTPCHLAILHCNDQEIAQYLIDAGANLNIQDNDGNTAAHLVVIEVQAKTIEHLVQKDLDLTIRNNSGNTALQEALNRKRRWILICLIRKSGDILPIQDDLIISIIDNNQFNILKDIISLLMTSNYKQVRQRIIGNLPIACKQEFYNFILAKFIGDQQPEKFRLLLDQCWDKDLSNEDRKNAVFCLQQQSDRFTSADDVLKQFVLAKAQLNWNIKTNLLTQSQTSKPDFEDVIVKTQ